jgi:predicted NAD-dependent protein-ADP-ribosyltransferase YbiA (DUF1768 family)
MITLQREWSPLNPRIVLPNRYADPGQYRTYHYSTVEAVYCGLLVDKHFEAETSTAADREYIKNLLDQQPDSRIRRTTVQELQANVAPVDQVKAWYQAYWNVIQQYPTLARLLKTTGDEMIVHIDRDCFTGQCYVLDNYHFCQLADVEFYMTEVRMHYGTRLPKPTLTGENKVGKVLMHIRGRL